MNVETKNNETKVIKDTKPKVSILDCDTIEIFKVKKEEAEKVIPIAKEEKEEDEDTTFHPGNSIIPLPVGNMYYVYRSPGAHQPVVYLKNFDNEREAHNYAIHKSTSTIDKISIYCNSKRIKLFSLGKQIND
jgi:hypothetical protein